MFVMDPLIVRAITAYYRTRALTEQRQPGAASACVQHQGKAYVVLKDGQDPMPLAVYRCMNRGELKRLKRWPAGLLAEQGREPVAPAALHDAVPVLLDLVPVARKAQEAALGGDGPAQAGLF